MQSFPGADVGKDHELVVMNFWLWLKKIRKQKNTRIKSDLETLKDPNIAGEFKAMIGSKFAPYIYLERRDQLLLVSYDTGKVGWTRLPKFWNVNW